MNGRVLLDGENTADVGFAVRKSGFDRRRVQPSDETAFGDRYSGNKERE